MRFQHLKGGRYGRQSGPLLPGGAPLFVKETLGNPKKQWETLGNPRNP